MTPAGKPPVPGTPGQLYNLAEDPLETDDLWEQKPEIVARCPPCSINIRRMGERARRAQPCRKVTVEKSGPGADPGSLAVGAEGGSCGADTIENHQTRGRAAARSWRSSSNRPRVRRRLAPDGFTACLKTGAGQIVTGKSPWKPGSRSANIPGTGAPS
jgi:hypothetical protein